MDINYEDIIREHLKNVAGSKNDVNEYCREGRSITLDALDLQGLLRDAFFKAIRVAYEHGCADGNQEDVSTLKNIIRDNEIDLADQAKLIKKLLKRPQTAEEVLDQYEHIKESNTTPQPLPRRVLTAEDRKTYSW